MSTPDITGPCCCGGSPDNPNPDCERCWLVGEVGRLRRDIDMLNHKIGDLADENRNRSDELAREL